MCQANFLAMMAHLLRPSSVSMSTSMEIAFDCSFCFRLLLLGSQGGASSLEVTPDSMDRWNWYTKLGPFFTASSFDHNFQPNNNQTFIVYMKSTLVLYRKGLCGVFQFRNLPRKIFDMERSVATILDQREYVVRNTIAPKKNNVTENFCI